MKFFGTIFWIAVLGISVVVIAAGFSGGQALKRVAAAPKLAIETTEEAPITMQRALVGVRGTDGTFDPVEAHVDDVVVDRPKGWAPPNPPGPRDQVRLAIIILGIGEDRTIDKNFQDLPVALTFAITSFDQPPTQPLRDDMRALLIAPDPSMKAANVVEALEQFHAGGVLTAIAGDPPDPNALLARLANSNAFTIDGMADGAPAIYRRARAHKIPSATRDLVIDAYVEEAYIAYMLRQAASLARRTGVAIAIGHAYPETYEALRRTLPTFAAQDIVIVPAGELVR